jgi:hypothetical protein
MLTPGGSLVQAPRHCHGDRSVVLTHGTDSWRATVCR